MLYKPMYFYVVFIYHIYSPLTLLHLHRSK